MMKERSSLRRTGLVMTLTVLMLAVAIMSVQGSAPAAPPADDAGKPRADIIRIDGLKQFGALERPAVVYLHERHTQALSKKNKDCAACHLPDKKYLSTKFKRLTDASRQTVMDIYHDNCTACHRQTADAGEKSGPVVCAGCHQDRAVASSWADFGMDKSLHYRHVKAQDSKCEACHHQVDPVTKKLVYVKGKEDDCRYCHLEKTVDSAISMRLAAHTQCIDCHRKRLAESKDAGPATCGGCHDAAVQRKIAKVKDVPRLMRGQPDVTIVQAVKSDGQKVAPFTRMSVVPFNHVAHEAANDTCRACHHSSMDACGKCHTLQGSKDGKFVNLQTAMHRASAQASCVGCHDGAKARKECAGCHATMARKDPPELSGCVSCHMPKPAAATPETAPKDMAAMLLAARKPVTATYRGRGHPGDGRDQVDQQAVPGGQDAAPQDRPDPGEEHPGQHDRRRLPPRPRDRLPGLPPQQSGGQEAAELRELPRPVVRRAQPHAARPPGGLPPAVHGVPPGHGAGQADGDRLHRLSQGQDLNPQRVKG